MVPYMSSHRTGCITGLGRLSRFRSRLFLRSARARQSHHETHRGRGLQHDDIPNVARREQSCIHHTCACQDRVWFINSGSILTISMGGNTGALFFGFLAGSALTAAAAYLVVSRDLERLAKEKKRLEEEHGATSGTSRSAGTGPLVKSSAAAVAAAGEHVGFLTDIMKQLWGYVKVAGAASIKETVEPMFKDMMPGPLAGLHFTKIDLGSIPIRMDNAIVHKVDSKNNTLQFDLDLVWDGE